MTESQSGMAHGSPLLGGAEEFDAPSNPGSAPTALISADTEAVRGSRRRSQWLSSPAGGGGAAGSGPGGRRQLGKRSVWALGGAAVLVIAMVAVIALTLPGGAKRSALVTSPSPSSAPSVLAVPNAGKLMPLGSAAHSAHKASRSPSKPSSAPAAVTITVAAAPPSPSAAKKAATPKKPKPKPLVVSLPEPVSWWYLNDDTGTTALDAMGGNPATGANTNWCGQGGNCATFNGTSSAFTTSGPVLATAPGSSFTVAAGVYMTGITANNGSETILSQDGAYDSGFYLQYSGYVKRWSFARVSADSDQSPAGIRALSKAGASTWTWTELVGVFDAADDQLRLYVNGVLQSTATDSAPFAATGPMAIGRAQFNGQPTDWFNGAANNIRVFNTALTAAQVKKL